MKFELKKQEGELLESITGLEKAVAETEKTMEALDLEFNAVKNIKAYTKMQLKDLYFRILKDDHDYM